MLPSGTNMTIWNRKGGEILTFRLLLCFIIMGLLFINLMPFYRKNTATVNQKEKCATLAPQVHLEITKKPETTTTKVNQNNEAYETDIGPHGYWRGKSATAFHAYDQPLATAFLNFFIREKISSVIDLGAGMGLYSKIFMKNNILTSCYDGNPNTLEISEGRCAVVDLSRNLNFSRYDWVLSLEVGEHIPVQFEDTFVNNLDRVNKYGIIVSWSIENQGGHGHVNNRNNDYIIKKITKMGYQFDKNAAHLLRNQSTLAWFKNTIMVFRKIPRTARKVVSSNFVK